MHMKNFLPSFLFLIVVWMLAGGCSSGKKAFERGDYYDAVLQAVNRLRQKPDHKKSIEVLKLSYMAAVEYLENDAQNQITSNANFKWRNAVSNYEKINNLYEQIRTSPGAQKVIPNPVNRYKELTELKQKAAEETYEAGIQYMMKNTRQDAKQAYFLFTEANGYSPGYREAIEMRDQAKFNATLRVVVEPMLDNSYGWDFESAVFGARLNEFVKFYTPDQAQRDSLKRIDQFLRVSFNGYQESRPNVTKRSESYADSVKTGEKTVGGQKVPVYQKVSGQATIYEKTITSRGSVRLEVVDAQSRAKISSDEVVTNEAWRDSWAQCGGDARAIPQGIKRLCEKREPYMERNFLLNQVKRELDNKLANTLSNFYAQY